MLDPNKPRTASGESHPAGPDLDEPPVTDTVVVCPPGKMPAAVAVNEDDRIVSCSRRDPGAACSEDCTTQLHYTADKLEHFLRTHHNTPCARCGKPIGVEDWYASRLKAASLPEGVGASDLTLPSAGAASHCYACWTELASAGGNKTA